MRKKLTMLLLTGVLLAFSACSGKNAEEPDGATLSGQSQAGNTAPPQATPEIRNTSNSKVTPEPQETAITNAISDLDVPESKATLEPVSAFEPTESEYAIEELITSIKMPEEWYTFSCDKNQVIFYSREEEYGWLSPYKITPVKGMSEVDSIILDLSGASDTAELIDTREEENVTRYVFVIHRSRYAMAEVEFLAQAGIISEEEALAQEQTELFIAYKVNGSQWWGFGIRSDVFGGEGLLDALKFEITFAQTEVR